MSEPIAKNPVPDGWDFPLDFLETPHYLPPYVRRYESAVLGPAGRATAAEVQSFVRKSPAPHAQPPGPHDAVLAGIHAIVDDRRERRHRLVPGSLVLAEELLNRHLLIDGPPGVGKTTAVMLPLIGALLRNRHRTVVVFDPKGDQFPLICSLAAQAGRSRNSVVRLNLTDPNRSVGWNPLRPGIDRTEALAIATALVMSTEVKNHGDSPFWRNSAMELLVEIVLGIARDPSEPLTLPRVLEVLNQPRGVLLPWLRSHGAHKFAAFLESGSHNAETCLADVGMRLLALFDRDLCAVLSHAELDLDQLFKKPMVLVVEMSEARIDRLRPIWNLLVQQILDRAIAVTDARADARLPFPVSLVIDEFGSAIGTIPRFPVYLNTLRSRRVGIAAAVQSISQILALYGPDAGSVLAGFSSKIFFPNVELGDAEALSRVTGSMTVGLPQPDGQLQWASRRVFLPEEVIRPREHPVLGRPVTMRLADKLTVQLYLTPCYRLPQFRVPMREASRKRRRPRRKVPLTYLPHVPVAAESRFVDTTGMSRPRIAAHLDLVENRIGFANASPAARDFWLRWRIGSGERLAGVLRFAEELHQRGATVQDYFDARCECNTEDPEVNLRYLDYLLARRRATPRPRAE